MKKNNNFTFNSNSLQKIIQSQVYKGNLQFAPKQQGDIALYTTLQYIPHIKAEVFNSI